MAYASFRFIKGIVTAKSGTPVIEEAYVYLPGISGGKDIADEMGVDYFAVKVELGESGAVGAVPVGDISDEEKKLLEIVIRDLKGNIETGELFV